AAALNLIVEERLWERAERIGGQFRERLAVLRGPAVSEIRGLGLLIGIEFAEAATARRFVAEAIASGVVINWTLNADRVVRLAPPLTITEEEIEFAIAAMTTALAAAQRA
ncbi:MAG TPA: aminotransferase class III-fold pyridoxal phosphate-dependent enzyme, partial [Candidatus Binataceae bacterium]|nr:aminotransferase class III-fold pyridoxal phosphate-dependent enzyme [Candidatus Binataceae bacterium]